MLPLPQPSMGSLAMPRTNEKDHHLKLHFNTWVFRKRWPKDVREYVRETEFIKSLQTKNLHTARLERDVLLADCNKVIHILRSDDSKARQQELLLFRKRWSERNPEDDDLLKDQIFSRAVDLNIDGGMDVLLKEYKKDPTAPSYDYALKRLGVLESVNDYIQIATHQKDPSTATIYYLNEWISWRKKDVIPKTVDDGKAVVLKFSNDFPNLDDVASHQVRRWFENKRHELSASRRKKIKGHLVSYWKFLQRNLDAPVVPEDVDPFAKVEFPKVKRSEQKEKWQPFPRLGEEIVEIMEVVQAKRDFQVWKMMFVMMYSGLRPEEVARLKKDNVHLENQNEEWFFVPFEDTKSPAGERNVPIHPKLVDFMGLQSEVPGAKGSPYLLPDINSQNKYGIRSDNVNKRFGRIKKGLGYGKKHVLYSIRKSVITTLHQANVSGSDVVPYIVGHEPPVFTLQTYSGGASMEQKRVGINKLQYPDFDHDFWLEEYQ